MMMMMNVFVLFICSSHLIGVMTDESQYYSPGNYYDYYETEYDSNITDEDNSGCSGTFSCYQEQGLWGGSQHDPECGYEVNCVGVSDFPHYLPPNTTNISIQDGSFNTLIYDDFENLTDLAYLSVLYSNLTSIEPGTFRTQTKLQRIYFTFNNLSDIREGTFVGLHSVTSMDLNRNGIKRIYGGSFMGLSNVTDLNLSFNLITSLDNYVFRGLRSLENLLFQENNISSISPFAFYNLTQLKTLNLKSNHLMSIPTNSLKILPNLITLFLGENPITSIERNSMKGLRSLRYLWLEGCHISTIARRAFNKRSIHTLVLERNRLNNFPNLGSMSRLRVLRLSGNPWSCDRNAIPMLMWLRRHDMIDESVKCFSPPSKWRIPFMDLTVRDLEEEAPITPPLPINEPPTDVITSSNLLITESSRTTVVLNDVITVSTNDASFTVQPISHHTSLLTSAKVNLTTEKAANVTKLQVTSNYISTVSNDEEISGDVITDDVTSILDFTSKTSTSALIVSGTTKQMVTNKTRSTKNHVPASGASLPVIIAVVAIVALFIALVIAVLAYRATHRRRRRRFPQSRGQMEGNVSCGLSEKKTGNGYFSRDHVNGNCDETNIKINDVTSLNEEAETKTDPGVNDSKSDHLNENRK